MKKPPERAVFSWHQAIQCYNIFMILYFLRHGETDWNVKGLAQGQVDTPLNSTGIRQAEAIRPTLNSLNFSAVYCSPLRRAVETAHLSVPDRYNIILDDNLKERFFGTLEGTSPTSWGVDTFDRKINTDFGGIEPIRTILARSNAFLNRLVSTHSADDIILIVAHGCFFKTLYFNIVGYDDQTDFRSFQMKNCELRSITV